MYNSRNYAYNYNPIFSSNLFNIPSPCMQYEHEFFFQYYHDQLQQNLDDTLAEIRAETAIINTTDSNKDNAIISRNELEQEEGCENKKGKVSSNKRVSKKDRHSKINTAKGPRDRRIRLSIDIARNFFNLQDMLRFEKASKTLEWLLKKSKSDIKELSKSRISKLSCSTVMDANSESSTSECEVVSEIDESPSNHKANTKGNSCNKERRKKKEKEKSVRRVAFFHPFAKESRKQARERARERTKLKKNFCKSHHLNLRSWNFSEGGEESAGYISMNLPCQEMLAEVEELTPQIEKQLLLGTKENLVNDCNLVVSGNWSPFSIFNYQQNAEIFHEHQTTDFPFP